MTFLELCQAARQEMGISGQGPASVENQVGVLKSVVDWVNRAWMEIQRKHPDWLFLSREFTLETLPGVDEYLPNLLPTDLGHWDLDILTLYRTKADEGRLTPLAYPDFREYFLIGEPPQGRPQWVSVAPNRGLRLAPVPNDAYTLAGRYARAPAPLVGNAATPDLPAHYHEAIVYLAMQYYARQESAPEVLADAVSRYRELMLRMEQSELPEITLAGPLV